MLNSHYYRLLARSRTHFSSWNTLRTLRCHRAQILALTVHCLAKYSTTSILSQQPAFSPEPAGSTLNSQVKLTAESYQHLARNATFKHVSHEDVKVFREILGKENALIDGVTSDGSEDLQSYNVDWMRKYRGQAKLVLKPATTAEISKILEHCNKQNIPVSPQGGNTGLVGGSVPVFDEVVLNLSRMNKIRSFDDVSGVFATDTGVILEDADNYLKDRGYIFPLDLGAKGSCQIGGNIATNAGGLRLLRYGSLHGSVLGIEAVLPDGTIINDLSKLRKNNTGYDIKQLFIGGEGTIGIVTGVSIQCPRRPAAVNVAYLALSSYEKVQAAFKAAKGRLGEILSAFELMDRESQSLYKKATGANLPLGEEHPFYCLIETSGSNSEHDRAKLTDFLESVMSEEIVVDGVLAENQTQLLSLWACREGISEASQHFGGVYKYDLSIPLPDLYKIVAETREIFRGNDLMGPEDSYPVIDIVGYGHMGDSNVHINVATRCYDKRVEAALEPWIYERVAAYQGSISAEHGLGFAKKGFVKYSKDEVMMSLMKQIKDLYDPKGIMNPYKYI